MKKTKSLSSYIPEREIPEGARLIQAKINPDLFERFNTLRESKKLKWKVFFESAMLKYLDENNA